MHAPYAFLLVFPQCAVDSLAKSTLLHPVGSLLSIIARHCLEARDLLLSRCGDFLHVLGPGEHVKEHWEWRAPGRAVHQTTNTRGSSYVKVSHRFRCNMASPYMLVTLFVRVRQIRVFVQGGRVFWDNRPDELEHGRMTNELPWLILRVRPNVSTLLFPHHSMWLLGRTVTRDTTRAGRVHLWVGSTGVNTDLALGRSRGPTLQTPNMV